MLRHVSPPFANNSYIYPPHDLPLLLLLLLLRLSWGAHGYAARLGLPPSAARAEGARSYTPTAGLQLLLLAF